ncbi:MAG: hypothetical protein WC745_01125 [Patescibacteria group bacterium]|jgi:hypothetical protein
MKLTVKMSQLPANPEQFLRRAGYGYIEDRRRGTKSFVRRLGAGFYPRLHMYAEREGESVSFNLHLDQKQASYAGARAHNAEYGGSVVSGEMERIKNLLLNAERAAPDPIPVREKGWWRKTFS